MNKNNVYINDKHLRDAATIIHKLLSETVPLCEKVAAKKKIGIDIIQLEEKLAKIKSRSFEIAVCGGFGVGKSSLVKALLGEKRNIFDFRAGSIGTLKRAELKIHNDYKVVLVDTPGASEIDCQAYDQKSEDAVRSADLVLFIVDEDLKDHEMTALIGLHDLNKPIIVVFNKIDGHTDTQRKDITESILEKLAGVVAEENFIPVSADPSERVYIIERADGTVLEDILRPEPIVENLQKRIFEILAEEGGPIIALNAILFANEVSEKVKLEKIRIKENEATSS